MLLKIEKSEVRRRTSLHLIVSIQMLQGFVIAAGI